MKSLLPPPNPLSSAKTGYSFHPGMRGLHAAISGVAGPVALERLSLHDGELRLSVEAAAGLARGVGVEVRLQTQLGGREEWALALQARCVLVGADDAGARVVFEHRPAPEDAVTLNQVLQALHAANLAHSFWEHLFPDFEEVRESPERTTALLQAMVVLHHEIVVHAADGTAVSPARLSNEAYWPDTAFTVDVRAPRADYVFSVAANRRGAERGIRLVRAERRNESLASAPPRTYLQFRHPVVDTGAIRVDVAALARSSIYVRPQPHALLYPGLRITEARMMWKGGDLRLAFVVGETLDDPVHGPCCRLYVTIDATTDRRRWCREVDRVCHPNTRIDAGAYEDLWELYASSGYLHISDKNPAMFDHLKQRFHRAAMAFEDHPELGSQVTWRALDGLDGSVTFLTAWRRSALIYQFARQRERPLWLSGCRPLYDLYLRATEHVLTEGARWLVVYVQRGGAPFSRRVNYDFPARFADGTQCYVGLFRAWEIPVRQTLDDPRSVGGVHVEEPSGPEVDAWLETLPARRPPAYREAYDLTPDRVWLDEPTTRFRRAGLARRRAFLRASVGGRPVAMAWLEHLEEGVHLFGLLNSLRVDVFERVDPATEATVRQALVESAAHYFDALGVSQFIFFDEAVGLAPVEGAVHLGDADQALFTTRLVPELIEEVAIAAGAPPNERRSAGATISRKRSLPTTTEP